MKDIIKVTIEVCISNIEVDEEYYSFDYSITEDWKVKEKSDYSNSYENWMSQKQRKKHLADWEAVKIALQHYSER